MRAVICREYTGYKNLTLEEFPEPEMDADGVRIDGRAAGVSFATSLVVAGKYQRRPPLPFAPGAEYAGIVTEIGANVTHVAPGDRVTAALDWGGQADQAVASRHCTYPMPDGMDFAEATALPLSYGTSYAALLWKARLQADESILVHAGASAVGVAAIQIAKAIGARVVATAGDDAKCAFAEQLGADCIINYRTTDFRDAVKAATDGKGADVIFDPVGGETAIHSLNAIRAEGRYLTIGYASGAIPKIPANLLLLKNISAIGLNYGTYVGWSPGDGREMYAPRLHDLHKQLADWYVAGKIRPYVSHRFPLAAFKEALETVLNRKAIGKVVLTLN